MTELSALRRDLIHKPSGVAYVRFSTPDLSKLGEFLVAFGLTVAKRTPNTIHFRGADASPFLYVATEGPVEFQGFAFNMPDFGSLNAFADRWSRPIEPIVGPGDGHCVRLVDPDGFNVDAAFFAGGGVAEALRPSLPVNSADATPRLGIERRLALTTACVCRLGHVVLQVSDIRRSEHWYKEHFGLLTSDEIITDDGKETRAMFLRLDRGATHTDHHSLFLLQAAAPAFHHAAFEVRDLDDLMVGHNHLKKAGYEHYKGVGRHLLGGQVFDYWRDPFGHVLEHWTDGDYFDSSWGPRTSTVTELMADTWQSSAKA